MDLEEIEAGFWRDLFHRGEEKMEEISLREMRSVLSEGRMPISDKRQSLQDIPNETGDLPNRHFIQQIFPSY